MKKIAEIFDRLTNPYGVDVHQFSEISLSDTDSVFIKVMEKDGVKRLVFCYKEREYRDIDIEYADMEPRAIDDLIAMLQEVKSYTQRQNLLQ